jgi:hypothetical protein
MNKKINSATPQSDVAFLFRKQVKWQLKAGRSQARRRL